MKPNPIAHAVDQAGGQTEVAKVLDISPQAVGHWCRKNRIPATRVLDLERLAAAGVRSRKMPEEAVTRYELRPDLYQRARVRKPTPPAVL